MVGENDVIKATQTILMPNGVLAQNIYVAEKWSNGNMFNEDVLPLCVEWMEDLYSQIKDICDSNMSLGQLDVTRVNSIGVALELIGSGNPSVTFTGSGDMLPNIMAGLAIARTNTPKVRGRKYWPGITEGVAIEGLLNGIGTAALAGALGAWLGGPNNADWVANFSSGVLSHLLGGFAPFNGSGYVTNIPGSFRTRRPSF